MQSNEFEQYFGEFLECKEYDEASIALFLVARTAFLAGWEAAGGKAPVPHRIFELLPKKDTEQS